MVLILILSLFTVPARAESPAQAPNVVIIALDAVQARRTSLHGHKRKTTPTLDRLAPKSFVFEQAVSPASWTVPTYLSVFTSLHPSQHGLTNRYREFSKEKQVLNNFKERKLITLAEVLKANGYRTGGFTGDSGVSAVLGYDKGFEVYTDETKFGGLANSWSKARAWLAGVKPNEKFFLFVHGYDSHGQFALPADFKGPFTKAGFTGNAEEQAKLREKFLAGEKVEMPAAMAEDWRAWYDSKIHWADAQVGEILAHLKSQGLDGRTIVAVFSDHGTEFFEHGRIDHGHSLYDELIHVPLVIHDPRVKSGKWIKAQVSTMDLMPTLLELLALTPAADVKAQMKGVSLVPLTKGGGKGHDVYSETDYRNYTHKRALRTADGWKYIMTVEDGREELYNLKRDPLEKKNLAGDASARAKFNALRSQLMAHTSALPPPDKTTGCLPVYAGQCEYY